MKITIGVPIFYPYVHWRFWRSYEQLEKPGGTILQIIPGSTIAVARNKLVNMAKGSDYLLFLDSDMTFPSDLIQRLLDHKKDVVCGLYYSRGYPHDPMTMRLWNKDEYYRSPPKGGLMEVDATGGGCMLINMKVIDKIDFPWFDFSAYMGTRKSFSEDVWFCRKLKAAGYKIYVDTDLECGHISDRVITGKDWRKPTVRTFEEFDKMREEK